LDELYSTAGAAPEKRLAVLEQNHEIVSKRDDALSCEIGMKVFAGKYDEAIQLMTGRKFSVWEGGSLDVAQHWVNAHLLRGQKEFNTGQFQEALRDFGEASSIPDNLPSEREIGRDPEINYWLGMTCKAKGDMEKARAAWQRASGGAEPIQNRKSDRLSERQVQTYFQALAKKNLGLETEAENAFRSLVETAAKALSSESDAASTKSKRSRRGSSAALAHYVAGLGHLGLGETDVAKAEFESSLKNDPAFLGAHAETATLGGRL
jgi:tetratricopeptide (TPR) repeat protein